VKANQSRDTRGKARRLERQVERIKDDLAHRA
jgi:hypothetical protein